MVLQWATKRLLKLLLKRLNPFLLEDIDVEQLDVQLRSGTAELQDLALNAEYISNKLKGLPVVIKSGSITRAILRLPCDIEIEDIELTAGPRQPVGQDGQVEEDGRAATLIESAVLETKVKPYIGVSDGVRLIGQMIKSLLLRLRIKLTRVSIRVEGVRSTDYVTLLVPSLEYGWEEPAEKNEESVVKVVRINANLEAREQQTPLFEEKGVSARIEIRVVGAAGSRNIDLDIKAEPVSFRASADDIKQLLTVTSSFVKENGDEETGSVYHDTGSFYDSGFKSIVIDAPKCALPVISDWMQKPEPELEASLDEFFECLDQSAAGSGIWQLTRSMVGAPSSSGSLYGTPEDIRVEFSLKARLKSLSVELLFDRRGDGVELILEEVSLVRSHDYTVDIQGIEVSILRPSTSQQECFSRVAQAQATFPESFSNLELLERLGKVQVLRIDSLSEQPAAKIVLAKRRRSGDITAFFQPVVLWIDCSILEQLVTSVGQLQASVQSCSIEPVRRRESNDDLVVEVRAPVITAIFSASSKSDCLAALRLEGASATVRQGIRREMAFSVANGFISSLCGSSAVRVISLVGKAVCEIKLKEHSNTGPSVVKKSWDSVAVHTKTFPVGGNADFASASNMRPEIRTQVLDMLKTTSAVRVNVTVSQVGVDLSTPSHMATLELASHFLSRSVGEEVPNSDNDNDLSAQVLILISAREAAISLPTALKLRANMLRITNALALGGDSSASYFQLSHNDAWLTRGDAEVLSCKATVIGRGDGRCGNALSTGSAGLTFTMVSWPGKEELADVLTTIHMNGVTLVTQAGNFEWVSAVTSFVEQCAEPFRKVSEDQPCESEPPRSWTCVYVDVRDAAVRYEPSGASSTACVLALASLRVQGGERTYSETFCYDITARDLGLHVVNRKLRELCADGKTLEAEGYVQVAGAPEFGATLKVNGNQLPNWVVESSGSQLNLDTCSDTTAAFGQLVADIQQLFAPDIPETTEVRLRRMKGKETDTEDEPEPEDLGEPDELFNGMVENAFAPSNHHAASSSRTVVEELTDFDVDLNKRDSTPFINEYCVLERVSETTVEGNEGLQVRQEKQSGGNGSEAAGGWFGSFGLDVVDMHVPVESFQKFSSIISTSSLPEPTGKVHLTGCNVTWKLYEGSDWRRERSNVHSVEVTISGLDVQHDSFAPTGLHASSLNLNIHEIRVYDSSENAPWQVLLGYDHKISRPRESTSKAVSFRMDAVRPNAEVPLEEYRVYLALLPIRVHLDQEHVDFFTRFFSPENEDDESVSSVNNALLPYFQVCEMKSARIRVDYVPRRMDFGALTAGNFVELLNLCSWKGLQLKLKPVHLSGVYGWGGVTGLVLGQWLQDISLHQIPLYLKCAAPIRPVCAVGSGAVKLFLLPAEQYKKDKRFLKGIRKGATAFVKSLSLEALGLGANLAAGAHEILSQTEVALGGEKRESKRSKKQPSGPREGLKQAYRSITQGLEKTAVSLVANPVKVYQQGEGARVAVASAIRASPAAILAPASAAAEAVRQTLIGVRNGLDPERRRDRAEERRR